MARQKRDENVVKLANELLKNNSINNAQDLQDVLRDVMGSEIETMLEGELTTHLDYEKYQNSNGISNRRNGTSGKKVRSTYGEMEIDVPRDCEGGFEPVIVEKEKRVFHLLKIKYYRCMHVA